MTNFWTPAPMPALPVRDRTERAPVNRLFFVGRNYHALAVNGQTTQKSDVDRLIWNIREIIEDLAGFYQLQPGHLIYTGTPDGVGAVLPGGRITGHVAGIGEIALTVGPAA